MRTTTNTTRMTSRIETMHAMMMILVLAAFADEEEEAVVVVVGAEEENKVVAVEIWFGADMVEEGRVFSTVTVGVSCNRLLGSFISIA